MARARASGYDPRKDLRHQGSRARAEAKATVLATSAVTGETIELNARAPRAMSAEDWGRVLDLIRPLISQPGLSPAAARNVLRLVGYTAVGPLRVGIALTPALLLDIETVDRFLTTDGMRYSVAMRSRIQAAARQLGRALGLPGYPPLVTR